MPQQDITLLVLASLFEKMSATLDGLNASSAKTAERLDALQARFEELACQDACPEVDESI